MRAWRWLRRRPRALASAVVLLLVVLAALAAPLWPFSPTGQQLRATLTPPGAPALEGGAGEWPAAEAKKLGFSDEKVAVYDGTITIPFTAEGDVVTLRIQACSDEICLEPEEARFRLR